MSKNLFENAGQIIGTGAAGVLFISAIAGSIAFDFIILYAVITNAEKSESRLERTFWTFYLFNLISERNRSRNDLGVLLLLSPLTSGLAIGLLYAYNFNLAASIIACSWVAGVALAVIAIACATIAEYQAMHPVVDDDKGLYSSSF